MNIKRMKFLDSVFGPMVTRCLPPPEKKKHFQRQNVLFIRPGGIGDAVHLVPVIISLKNAVPNVRVTVLAEKRNDAVFAMTSAVDRVFLYDRPADFVKILGHRFDVVIDTEQWHRFSAVFARLINAPVSIGFDTNERRRLFTHLVGYSHNAYEMTSFQHLLLPLGVEQSVIPSRFLQVPAKAAERAADFLGDIASRPFVAIFPGASITERRWGAGNFHVLVRALSEREIPTVVVGGKDDHAEGEEIAGSISLQLAGKTTLAETAAIIERSAILVSGDSGILHLGVGLGCATVSLFGAGLAKKWAPRGGRHRVINKNLSCSPCTLFGTTPPCNHDAVCLRSIYPEEVAAAVGELWSREVVARRREKTPDK